MTHVCVIRKITVSMGLNPLIKKLICCAFVILLTGARLASAQEAATHFYGVKMKSESYARMLSEQELKGLPDSLEAHPGMDKNIFAQAQLVHSLGERRLEIQVYNHTDRPLSTRYALADYSVITQDGQRHELKDPAVVWHPATESIPPQRSATFVPRFGNSRVRNEDIRLVVCSFNLDETKIVLFPVQRQVRVPAQLQAAPPAAEEPMKAAPAAAKKHSESRFPWLNLLGRNKEKTDIQKSEPPEEAPAPAEKQTVAPAAAQEPAPTKPWLDFRSKDKPQEEPATPEKKGRPWFDFRKKGEEVKAAAPKKETLAAPSKEVTTPGKPHKPWINFNKKSDDDKAPVVLGNVKLVMKSYGSAAQVLEVNRIYGFVVLNAGSKEGLKKDDVILLLRNGKLISRAVVQQLKEDVAAAYIVPQYSKDAPQVGDNFGKL